MKRVMFVCKRNSCRSQMAEDYDVVISLCGCGGNLPDAWISREVFEDWQLDDPDGQPLEVFHRVRDEIKEKVVQLIQKLTFD